MCYNFCIRKKSEKEISRWIATGNENAGDVAMFYQSDNVGSDSQSNEPIRYSKWIMGCNSFPVVRRISHIRNLHGKEKYQWSIKMIDFIAESSVLEVQKNKFLRNTLICSDIVAYVFWFKLIKIRIIHLQRKNSIDVNARRWGVTYLKYEKMIDFQPLLMTFVHSSPVELRYIYGWVWNTVSYDSTQNYTAKGSRGHR